MRWVLFFLIFSTACSACPTIEVDTRVLASELQIGLRLDPLPLTHQVLLTLSKNATVISRALLSNTSMSMPRPTPGSYLIEVESLYPPCPSTSKQTMVVAPQVQLTYHGSTARLREASLWLSLCVSSLLAIVLILRR